MNSQDNQPTYEHLHRTFAWRYAQWQNSIPKMAHLRAILEKAGFVSVETYIHSGNIYYNPSFLLHKPVKKYISLLKKTLE